MNQLVLVVVQKLEKEKEEVVLVVVEEEEEVWSPSPKRPLLQRPAINKWIDFWTSDSFPS